MTHPPASESYSNERTTPEMSHCPPDALGQTAACLYAPLFPLNSLYQHKGHTPSGMTRARPPLLGRFPFDGAFMGGCTCPCTAGDFALVSVAGATPGSIFDLLGAHCVSEGVTAGPSPSESLMCGESDDDSSPPAGVVASPEEPAAAIAVLARKRARRRNSERNAACRPSTSINRSRRALASSSASLSACSNARSDSSDTTVAAGDEGNPWGAMKMARVTEKQNKTAPERNGIEYGIA